MHKLAPSLLALLCAAGLAACGSSTPKSTGTAAGHTGTGTAAAGATGTGTATASQSQPTIGFEGVPLQKGPEIAPASTTGTGKVNGITCGPTEQLVYHIHARLSVFRNGQSYVLPAGVGIPGSQAQETNQGPIASGGSCIYWLHTHTTDGVIHIESPTKKLYTLGDFFDIWRQPLSGTQIGTLHGAVTAFVNGKPWKQNPREIKLLPHLDIQLQIGEPAPPIVKTDWSQTQL
jgi:hypothetical protein